MDRSHWKNSGLLNCTQRKRVSGMMSWYCLRSLHLKIEESSQQKLQLLWLLSTWSLSTLAREVMRKTTYGLRYGRWEQPQKMLSYCDTKLNSTAEVRAGCVLQYSGRDRDVGIRSTFHIHVTWVRISFQRSSLKLWEQSKFNRQLRINTNSVLKILDYWWLS